MNPNDIEKIESEDVEIPESVPGSAIGRGWLWRRSRYLKQWKRAWFVLWSSGNLKYYADPSSTFAKGELYIPGERTAVLGWEDCKDISPPLGVPVECVFGIHHYDGHWFLAADDEDTVLSWKEAILEVLKQGSAVAPYLPLRYSHHLSGQMHHLMTFPCCHWPVHVAPNNTYKKFDLSPVPPEKSCECPASLKVILPPSRWGYLVGDGYYEDPLVF